MIQCIITKNLRTMVDSFCNGLMHFNLAKEYNLTGKNKKPFNKFVHIIKLIEGK